MTDARFTPRTPRPQRLRGVVVGAHRMDKTVTVRVERLAWHRKLRKQYRQSKKFLVHTEWEEVGVGDVVTIVQTRPLSRRKHFRLLQIDRKAAERATAGDAAVGTSLTEEEQS